MSSAHKPIWVILVVFASVAAMTSIYQLRRPREIIPWRTDLAIAHKEAAAAKKPVFAYFAAEWCPSCQLMKTTTWANHEVEAALQRYVPVKIDVDRAGETAIRYQVENLPAFAVLDDQGNVVKFKSGPLSTDQFLAWLPR